METEILKREIYFLLGQDKLDEAKDLLLEHGFVKKLDPEISKLFFEFIPESPILIEQKENSLRFLFDKSEEKRLAAAKFINLEAHNVITKFRSSWLKDPRTVEILIRSLPDENTKVTANITRALRQIASRYYPDLRIYPVMLNMLQHPEKDVRYEAIWGVGVFSLNDYWPELIPYLTRRYISKFRRAVARVIIFNWKTIDEANKAVLQNALLTALQCERVLETKLSLIGALARICDTETLEILKTMRKAEKNPIVKSELAFSIKSRKP